MDKQIINEEIVRDAYDAWLGNPITSLLLKNVDKIREEFVKRTATNATSPDVSAEVLRWDAIGVKNIDAVKKLITDYETFKNYFTR